jgi:NADP-reducing hydrogenase subunit HndD
MYVVSIMPCTAKKFEIHRNEMQNDGHQNVDAVLTTRELGLMMREAGIVFDTLEDREFDNPLGMSTGAGDIFGVTGGVMEAALRTVYELVTGRELPFKGLHVEPIVGLEQVKSATIKIEGAVSDYAFLEGVDVNVAVTSGLAGAKLLMDEIVSGESTYHFIEIMGCPGGCITGGGQPRSDDPDVREKRMKAIYSEDEGKVLRKSHENPSVQKLYKDYLEYPNSHVSHELLHTSYVKRGIFNEYIDEDYLNAEVKPETISSVHIMHTTDAAPPQSGSVAQQRVSDEVESVRVLALEAEVSKLKKDLADSTETVDILKEVMSDYAKKPNR